MCEAQSASAGRESGSFGAAVAPTTETDPPRAPAVADATPAPDPPPPPLPSLSQLPLTSLPQQFRLAPSPSLLPARRLSLSQISRARALLTRTGPAGLEGVPAAYDDGTEWLRSGLRRHLHVSIIALFAGWTGVWIALWGAVIGAVFGVFIAVGVRASASPLFRDIGGGSAISAVSIAGGVVIGALGGFLYVLKFIFTNPNPLVGPSLEAPSSPWPWSSPLRPSNDWGSGCGGTDDSAVTRCGASLPS